MRNQTAYAAQGAVYGKVTRSCPFKIPSQWRGNPIGNRILLRLPAKEYKQMFPELELVRLKLHQVIHEAGGTIKSGYFVNSGLMSVLAVQPNGKSVEVGLIGREGFVGLPLLVGYHTRPTRIVTQGDGTAYRCDARALTRVLQECPELEQQLHRFAHQLAMQATQIAACNRLHNVEERLARDDTRPASLTNPAADAGFLGRCWARAAPVCTVAAGMPQKAGLISYTRGNVVILERERLEEAACDCYDIVQHQLEEWKAERRRNARIRRR